MDVDHMSSYRVAKDNDPQAKTNFNKLTGNRYSAMEHLVPEQMFSTEENKAEGISAVKAIAIAAAEGQKIYTISNDNLETALANITLAEDTETEIRNSVNAGYVVTAHEKQIDFNGWLGEGYIITDPVTGDAAYKISGGGNGGVLIVLYEYILTAAIFVSGIKFKFVSVVDFFSNAIAIFSKCLNNLGEVGAGLAVIGLILIFVTMLLGWIWIVALTTAAAKTIAGVLFAFLTTLELMGLSSTCNKRGI